MKRNTETFDKILTHLPDSLASILSKICDRAKEEATEIRLRLGRPLTLTTYSGNLFVTEKGEICYLNSANTKTVTANEIFECYRTLCDFSIHTHQSEIVSGFISLPNGNRAGVVGETVCENGKITAIKNITSINIRISREINNCAEPFTEYFKDGGVLIAGSPCCGKTTFLRDAIRIISNGYKTEPKRISLIDSRLEIAGNREGMAYYDIGILTDVIFGAPKAEGMELSIRSMNPQIIAFDEIGRLSEVEAVKDSLYAGVEIITTVHTGSVEELTRRNVTKELLLTGAIKYVLFIEKEDFKVTPYKVIVGDVLKLEAV